MRQGIAALVAAMLTMGSGGAIAQVNPAAEQAFRDGKRLMGERRFGEACEAFATSQRVEPNIATLMSLADCREKNGQLATAWSLFLEAEQTTRGVADLQDLHTTADERSVKLEPRLSYVTINVPDESRLKGLVVYRDSEVVDPGLWNRAVPVDGGMHRVEAKAPGHEPWLTEVTVAAEKDRQAVEVPRFKNLPAMATTTSPRSPSMQALPPPAHAEPRFARSRQAALGLGAVSLVAFGGTFILWSQAKSIEDDALALCRPTDCVEEEAEEARSLNEDAKGRAMTGNLVLGVGVAAAVAGGVLWYTGAPKKDRGISFVPQLGAVTGIAASGAF